MYNCKCKLCGNEFQARLKVCKVCEDCKNRPCEICGKNFKRVEPYDQKYCSKECRQTARKDPERIKIYEAKKQATVRAKYGVDNVSHLKEVKEKISASRLNSDVYNKMQEEMKLSQQSVPIIRQCIICGKDFEAKGSQSTCTNKHYKKCVVCGKDFEFKHISDKRQTCSSECKIALWKQKRGNIKFCEYCGKEFISHGTRDKYCKGPHFATCQICGKYFEIDITSNQSERYATKTCSSECRTELRKRTCLEKYGVEYAAQTEEAKESAKVTAIANTERRKQTNLERYGYEFYTQSPEGRERLSNLTASEEVQSKIKATSLARYGVEHPMQSAEFAKLHSASQFSHVAMDGTKVDSSWEQSVYNFFLRNGIEFEYNTHSIEYEYEGKTHVTHIDFKVGDVLLEVKGSHLLQGAYENSGLVVPISCKLDLYRKHHVIVVTDQNCKGIFGKPNSVESNGLKYLNKCPEPLIGVDINLFENPTFPFSEDRPPCFYKVKVDGERSSLDAFFDEKLRWKMITNRINYSGGFIDAKQVLTAMNVTRTCKQPSWFSKTLAKRIISQYCTSQTIVDCFAGWGMRHDAAIELNRNYIGIDFNPELVAWHIEKGRTIGYKDANDFKYEEECSVFICPPYSDPKTGRCFEDYSFNGFDESAKALSQCDWLKIVMDNVPNAKEYVMVCKIVDEEFKDYIVETLQNKSHLGTNNEYILVVSKS